jgi:uncharacterized protein (DUF58 family)
MPDEKKSVAHALLPDAQRRRFEPLQLYASRIRSGAMKGERRSIKRGTSIEFADYRNYTPGDDLRKLDWNVYARLERPYIKLLEDEEDLAVHILLDNSASMDWQPEGASDDHNKYLFARRLLAGLAYISLTTGDRLQLASLSNDARTQTKPMRGKPFTVQMLQYVQNIPATGVTDLNLSLRDYALRTKRAGLTLIISDMFSPTGFWEGVNTLLSKGHEVAILHVLSPDEVTPPMAGDLRLVDVETGRAQEVSIDATMREIYEERLNAWLDDIRNTCGKRGVHYIMATSDTPYERVMLYDLRRLGVVR